MNAIGQTQTRSRRGSVVLETVVVVGVSSLLMGVAIVSIHHLLTAHERLRDQTRDALVRQRLISLFREDCHTADSVVTEERTTRLISDDREVTYEVQDQDVFRSWKNRQNQGRDRFYSTRDWTVQITQSGRELQMTLSHSLGGSSRTREGRLRQVVIAAEVGRDGRHQRGLSESPANPPGDRQ